MIKENSATPTKIKPRPSWRRATSEDKTQYQSSLEMLLSQLKVPESVASCRDVHCQSICHKNDLDHFTLEVLETVQQVAENILPMPKLNSETKKRVRPGWVTDVKPYRDNAYF